MNIINIIRDIFCGTPSCPDTDYLTERITTLSDELSKCIGPIDIIEDYQTKINPYYVIKGYDVRQADVEYLTYMPTDWSAILTRLHRHLGSKYEWTKDIYDCDDIALLYASTVAYSAYRAGLSIQPAFAIAWSNTHAFNLIIDHTNVSWIVEPQTGNVVGRLDEDNGDMYDVKKIWFMS